MDSLSRFSLSRVRWAVAFALLLLATSAVPVLADPPAGPEPSTQENPPDFNPSRLPDAQDIAEGINEVKAEEAEREQQLNSPAAVEEREDSEDAYEDLSSAAAEQLLTESFEEMLTALDADPARYLSEEKLLQPLDQTAATVSSDNGPLLMDSNVPVRARDEEGDLRKVNLTLDVTEEGLEPVNPIITTSIGASPEEGVEVGGIVISQVGADADSSARRFEGQNAFFAEVQPSTDLLVSPTSGGVEFFDQLRAAESPEILRFDLDLPEGAVLETSESGGAEVLLASGMPLASVSPPTAVDAQGTLVPVHMRIEGSALVLDVEHRGADFAYPILVDPKYQVFENWVNAGSNWFGGNNIGELENPYIWGWDRNTTKITNSTIGWHNWVGGSNRGLFTTSYPGSFGPWEYGQWSYWVPDWDVYIDYALIDLFWRNTNGCSKYTYPLPAEYDGLWDGGQWNQVKYEEAKNYNLSVLDSWGKILVIGLSSIGGGPDPCYRDLYVGGVGIWMGDWGAPTLSYPTGMPNGWISDTTPFTISANAWDAGLGVYQVTITPQETAKKSDLTLNCTGTRAKKCPENHTTVKTLTGASFDEGETTTGITAEDPTGETSTTHHWTTWVDKTPPKVTLSGQLANLTNEDGFEEVPDGNDKGDRLSFPVYNLTIAAEDGTNAAGPKNKRSGVREIEVFLDGKVEEGWYQPCPASSCPMTQVFQLKLAGLSAGQHALRVVARDYVGKVRERKIEFEYFPATGIKDEYVMQHFELPDGKDHSEEEVLTAPELAVNLMNGNLVYHERDVDIEGPGADLEVERFYNSQLPPEQDNEWGDGWTLAQTPELDPIDTGGSPAPDEAGLLDEGGSYDGGIELPASIGEEEFDPELQATIEKTADGYELSDETGETAGTIAFDQSGRTEELLTSGETTVDYAYDDGALSEIAVDDPGSTSLLPEEVEEPEAPEPTEEEPSYEFVSSFGASGAATGKFNHPADIAIDPSTGNLFIADMGNHRVQVFDPEGNYLFKFGDAGVPATLLNRPTALVFSPGGQLLVAETNSNQVKKYNASGEFLGAFGGSGTTNGKFNSPEGIAVNFGGNILVSDSGNGRVQEFNEAGEFLKVLASKGTGPGQLTRPGGLDVDAEGRLWISDVTKDRVVVLSEEGEFIQDVGTTGAGTGQFKQPDAIAPDPYWGGMLVGDMQNARVERFDTAFDFQEQLGSAGSGAGQLALTLPMGIATSGFSAWVTDTNNNRIQLWQVPEPPAPPEYVPVQDDPAVTLETDEGLISSLEGEQAGEHSYEHDGDLLTAHEGPEGKIAYEYDGADRMSKVTLPNGTWASIEYNAAYGRVKAVTVDPAGEPAAKTTHFSYSEEPRRTTVSPEGEPHVIYDIGPDGSVLKWWNTLQPPDLDYIAGTLYEGRETAAPIGTGDHTLSMQAHSEEGIASIEVIANGNTVVDEKHCEQDREDEDVECVEVVNEWVTNTRNWAPGILQLEVLATDELGMSTSERFWVNIPYTPPIPEGLPDPPEFDEVLHFREEYGLDLDLDPQEEELELNDRIFALINAWYEADTPLGEVARASYDRWGAPLRPVDVAEMMYREDYLQQDATAILNWAAAHAAPTYAGYYVDHRKGGIVYVGFTQNNASQVQALKLSGDVPAAARIEPMPVTPPHSLVTLGEMAETLAQNLGNATISQVTMAPRQNRLTVGAWDTGEAESWIDSHFGSGAPIDVITAKWRGTAGRWTRKGPVVSGHAIGADFTEDGEARHAYCSAGFGASEDLGKKNGKEKKADFVLIAGHCGSPIGTTWSRWDSPQEAEGAAPGASIGKLVRTSIEHEINGYATDAAAIRLNEGLIPPRTVYRRGPHLPITGVVKAAPGMPICTSGWKSDTVRQGALRDEITVVYIPKKYDENGMPTEWYPSAWEPMANLVSLDGDSGGPAWRCGTGEAIGLISSNVVDRPITGVAPLLPPPAPSDPYGEFFFSPEMAPGILKAPEMGDIHLTLSR